MNRCGYRRGSALLIVLGMMAFIIISALAFSAYMRYARMPSSYLRRTSSARLMVKAALAEAIEIVDRAIGNNPYPGVGGNERNVWKGRVFVGSQELQDPSTTISTLTLEGLAYIPPAFVNDVRYYSRRVPSACWQTLDYGAGRYVFCAVNVSDCFDVNRVIAESARSSADDMRITLAHCFESPDHTDYTLDPKEWDDFMKNYEDGTDTKIPLVSVADLNLAINNKFSGDNLKMLSPFCAYLKQSNNAKFVTDNSATDPKVEVQRNLSFVTDSFFAGMTNSASDRINLASGDDQPFAGLSIGDNDDEKKNDDTIAQLFRLRSKFINKYGPNLQRAERVQLYDYLDRDSVPLSLAIPTVERTPMITGVRMLGRVSLTLGDPRSERVDLGTTAYEFTGRDLELNIADLKAQASLVYPFKYRHGTALKYKAQAAATITFVKAGTRSLRLDEPKKPAIFERGDWAASAKTPTVEKYGSEACPVVVTMQSAPVDIEDLNSKTIKTEKDALLTTAVFDFGGADTITFPGAVTANNLPAQVALPAAVANSTFVTMQQKTINPQTHAEQNVGDPVFFTSFLPSNNGLDGVVNELESGARYEPVVQLWVRIIDENDQVVDLVPACYKDDEEESADLGRLASAKERPLVRFYACEKTDDAPIVNDKTMMDFKGLTFDFYPGAYFADDPRFNYAPENLLAVKTASGDLKDLWYENYQRSHERDGDIFMTTSDAGYLQSIYELTALLDCAGIDGDPDNAVINSSEFDGEMRTDASKLAADAAMWHTYTQYEVKEGDQVFGKDITRNFSAVTSGERGFRVNPFTTDPNIMMAALANTPIDWWACATNFENAVSEKKAMAGQVVRGRNTVDLDAAAPYTFSEAAEDGKGLKVKHGTRKNPDQSLMAVAQKLQSQFAAAGSEWETIFDQKENWDSDSGVAGVDLGVELHSVDKKFLNGFWRESFANRQHLFLIFVRAEPMMMGSGGIGHTPPQLGARAVALVWRDPTPNTVYPNGPHRTRVLFYRQFE